MATVTITVTETPKPDGGLTLNVSIDSDPPFPGPINKPTDEFTLAQLTALFGYTVITKQCQHTSTITKK